MMILADDLPKYEGYLALAYCILTGKDANRGLAKFRLMKIDTSKRYDQGYKTAVAKEAIELMAGGLSLNKASQKLGYTHKTIGTWVKNYKKGLN